MTNQNKINQINRLHRENYTLRQEIENLKSQLVDGDIAAIKWQVQSLETQLQLSQEKNTEYEVLLGKKDETIDEYLREIKKMNRALDSNRKFSKICSAIIYSITIWILNK